MWQSFLLQDAFGLKTEFVWLENFRDLFSDPRTIVASQARRVFSIRAVSALSLSSPAARGHGGPAVMRGGGIYRTLLIWPYAVAPAIAGVLWLFLFNPRSASSPMACASSASTGTRCSTATRRWSLVVIAAAWKQISYNFLFFLAGLQAIPKSADRGRRDRRRAAGAALLDHRLPAAVADHLLPAGRQHRLRLLRHLRHHRRHDRRRPGQGDRDPGLQGLFNGGLGGDLGGSAAQSVILMVIVIALTAIQFRYVERKVTLLMVEQPPLRRTCSPHLILILGVADRRLPGLSRLRRPRPTTQRRSSPTARCR